MNKFHHVMDSAMVGMGIAGLIFLSIGHIIEFIFKVNLASTVGTPLLVLVLLTLTAVVCAYFGANHDPD